jgi:carboxypeptidase family protein
MRTSILARSLKVGTSLLAASSAFLWAGGVVPPAVAGPSSPARATNHAVVKPQKVALSTLSATTRHSNTPTTVASSGTATTTVLPSTGSSVPTTTTTSPSTTASTTTSVPATVPGGSATPAATTTTSTTTTTVAASPGTIAGTVTATGSAIAGVCVSATPQAGGTALQATTGSTGKYSISAPAGEYVVEFGGCAPPPNNYLVQYYNGQISASKANLVAVTSGVTTSAINASLEQGGSVSGIVTAAADGSDISGICVTASQGSTTVQSTTTVSAGTYSLASLPAGSYVVEFSSGCGDSGAYLPQWYNNEPIPSSANPVSVTAGANTAGISASLVAAGSISGTVTSAANGSALAGICVSVQAAQSTGNLYDDFGSAITAADGTYLVTGLSANSYTAQFSAGCGSTGNYAPQYYKNKATLKAANQVAVIAGSTASGINAALAAGAKITGTVTAASNGAPLAGICVYVQDQSDTVFQNATTAADGTYSVKSLPADIYTVQFVDCNVSAQYQPQYWDDQPNTPTPVSVSAGATVSGINAALAALAAGGTITGTITAASTGAPLPGICVYSSGQNATTAADGTYTLTGVTPGTSVDVEFSDGCGAAAGYITQDVFVTVTSGQTTSGVDAAMVLGQATGAISGTITGAAGGAPLSGICVTVDSASGFFTDTSTATDGTYSVQGLTKGLYTVEFSIGCGNSGNYAFQYYPDEASYQNAGEVKVSAGKTTSGINGALAAGGIITGTVQAAAGGAPLSGLCVSAYSVDTGGLASVSTTNAQGTYALIGLATDSYDVDFVDCAQQTYAPQYYSNETLQSDANAVAVTAGQSTDGINASMVVGGIISGTVTNAVGGEPSAGICVTATLSDGTQYGPVATTAANGTYSITGLPSGQFDVTFSPGCGSSTAYLTQYYSGAYSQDQATTVSVAAGSTTSAINAAMTTPGTISGTVTAASGGAPLSGICVTASGSTGETGSATTATDGTYTITGLTPDNYTISFTTGCGNNGNYLPYSYPSSVQVTGGTTVSSINAALTTGATISGKVTAAATGNGLSGICVDASGTSGGSGSAITATDGTYTITGLSPDSYTVSFTTGCGNNGNYVPATYSSSVPVSAGGSVTGINEALAKGGTITGTVTAAAGGTPLAGVCVNVLGSKGSSLAITASNGTYSATGLPSGKYTVSFTPGCENPPSNYLPQTYPKNVSVTIGATTSGINGALILGGTIKGTVTSATTGQPLSGICVNESGGNYQNTTTSSKGTYSFEGLASGSYAISFSTGCGNNGNYLGQSYPQPVQVTQADTTKGINAALIAGGIITGTVTSSAGGQALSGICVNVTGLAGSGGFTSSGADGTYSVNQLPSGSYTVEFTAGCGSTGNFAPQYYNGQASAANANPVSVTQATTTSNINAAMTAGGTISGVVTDAATGKSAGGVCVTVESNQTEAQQAFATTAANGTYSIDSLPIGSFLVSFSSGCGSSSAYSTQYYKNALSPNAGTPVSTSAGTDTSGISAAMVVGGSISGTVTMSGGGPVANACIALYTSPDGVSVSYTSTFATGAYDLTGLQPGKYIEEIQTCESASNDTVWYNGAATAGTATPITVTAASTTANINTVFPIDGSIAGTVTKASNGKPFSGICVSAFSSGSYIAGATTASDGSYTISGLVPGSYTVEFSSDEFDSGCGSAIGVVTQYYNDQPSSSTADLVNVTASQTTSGINASLVAAGSVTGTVKAAGAGIGGVCVSAEDPSQDYQTDSASTTASNGSYTITGLQPGKYIIKFDTTCDTTANYGIQYYPGVQLGSATLVTVTAATATTGVNATLAAAGTISGKVTAASGPLYGTCVGAYPAGSTPAQNDLLISTATAADGTYTLNDLGAGNDIVEFVPCDTTQYSFQYYNDAATSTAATAVPVAAGANKTGIDATLTVGGTITGVVTSSADGLPLAGICANVYESGSTAPEGGRGYTNSDGYYEVTGLAAGTYKVEFSDCSGDAITMATQYYNNAASLSTATAITVGSGATVTGIDAAMSPTP